jgi:hypothetical protein
MSKKEIDIIREFVEIGFNEIKEETRYNDAVMSYTKLKELIVNNTSYNNIKNSLKFSDGNEDNSNVKSEIKKTYEDYEKKIKILKDELQNEESRNASTDNTSEDFLKSAIVLSSIAFNIILIKLYLDGDFRLLQLCGGIVIIIALTDASYRVINLLNYSVKNGNENADLHKNALNKLKKISKTGDDKHIFEFLKLYFEIESTSKNSHVKSKQVLEHFLRKQETFMLKAENIGVPNKKYTDRFSKFYDFMRNTDMTKELIHKYGKKQDDHTYTREHLYQTFDKNEMIETFKELYKKATGNPIQQATLKDDINSTSGDYTDEYYRDLFEKVKDEENKDENTLISAVGSLCTSLTTMTPESNYDTIFADLVKINNAFEILRLSKLPEYEQLCNQYFYKGLPEFKSILHEKDRYAIPDEYVALTKLKTHLSSCDAFGKGFIKDICQDMKKQTDIDFSTRVQNTMKAIRTTIVDDDKYLGVMVENVVEFNHKAKTDVILKNDLLNGKYESIVDIYERVFKKVFEHSGVIRIDMVRFFNERADKDFSTEESKGKNLFKHNGRKMIDVIFDNFDRNEEDLKIINTTPETMDKTKYITYDQYLQKMTAYDDDALKKMHDNFDMIHKDMDNIIIGYRSGKTKDDSTSIKINILKDMVHYYIAGSIFFMLDYFISLFFDASYANKKDEYFRRNMRELKNEAVKSVKKTAKTKTANLKTKYENTDFKKKFSKSISGLKEKALKRVPRNRTPEEIFASDKQQRVNKNWGKLRTAVNVKKGFNNLINEKKGGDALSGGRVSGALKKFQNAANSVQKATDSVQKATETLDNFKGRVTDGVNRLQNVVDTIQGGPGGNPVADNKQSEIVAYVDDEGSPKDKIEDQIELPPSLSEQIAEKEREIKLKEEEIENCGNKSNDADDEKPNKGETECDAKKRNLKKLEIQLKQLKDKFAKEKSKTYVNGMRFMTVFSIWILSVVLFYSFWMKSDSDYNYNEMIAINNSLKMRDTLERMKKHSKDAYVDKRNRPEHLRLLYEATKDLLVVQGKCNLTKQNQGVIFPTSDVFIGVTIIGICIMVILTNNMLNNPFEVMKKVKLIKQVMSNEEEIKKEINVKEDINGIIFDSLKLKEDFLKLLLKTTDDYERVQQDLKALQSLKAKYYSELNLEQSKANITRKQPKDGPTILDRMKPFDTKRTELKSKYDEIVNKEDNITITPSMYYDIIENHPEEWFNETNGLKNQIGTIEYVNNSGSTILNFDEKKDILLKFLKDKKYDEVIIWVKHYMNNKPNEENAPSPFEIIEQTINESEDPTKPKGPTEVTIEYPNHTTVVKAPAKKNRTQFLTEDHKKTAINILNMKAIKSSTNLSTDDFIKLRNNASLEFDKKVMPYIREAVKVKNDEIKRYIRELDNEVVIPYTTTNFTERKTLSEQEKNVNVEYSGTGGGGDRDHRRGGNTILSTGVNNNNNNNMNIDLDNIMKQYDTTEANETLDQLRGIDMSLIDMEKIEPIVNTSVSFSIFMLAIFMSYKIMNNAIKYKVELFNGKLFGESICM